MEKIYIKGAKRPAGHYASAVSDGRYVFVSGQLPVDPFTGEVCRGSLPEQTRRALENVALALEAAGSGIEKILKCTIYTSDIDNWDELNRAYAEFFGEHVPARSVVQAGRLHYGVLVEAEAVALA